MSAVLNHTLLSIVCSELKQEIQSHKIQISDKL